MLRGKEEGQGRARDSLGLEGGEEHYGLGGHARVRVHGHGEGSISEGPRHRCVALPTDGSEGESEKRGKQSEQRRRGGGRKRRGEATFDDQSASTCPSSDPSQATLMAAIST